MRFIDWRTYKVTWFGKRTSWQLVFVSCGIAHIEDEFTYRRLLLKMIITEVYYFLVVSNIIKVYYVNDVLSFIVIKHTIWPGN